MLRYAKFNEHRMNLRESCDKIEFCMKHPSAFASYDINNRLLINAYFCEPLKPLLVVVGFMKLSSSSSDLGFRVNKRRKIIREIHTVTALDRCQCSDGGRP